MYLYPISFLYKRSVDNKVVVGSTCLKFYNDHEYDNLTDMDKIKLIELMGNNVIRLVKPDENLIGYDFGG